MLPKLYGQLSAHGMDPTTPAVAVERGTTRRQRVVWGPVSELPSRAQAAGLKSPTLIIMGSVVALAPGWGAWEVAGRPLQVSSKFPSHGYALPQLDAAALADAAATAGATAAGGGGVGSMRAAPKQRVGATAGEAGPKGGAGSGSTHAACNPAVQQHVSGEGIRAREVAPLPLGGPVPGSGVAAATPAVSPAGLSCGDDENTACELPYRH